MNLIGPTAAGQNFGDQLEFSSTILSPEALLFKVNRRAQRSRFRSGLLPALALGFALVYSARGMSLGLILLVAVASVVSLIVRGWWGRKIVGESVLVERQLGIQLFAHLRNGKVADVHFVEKNRVKSVLLIEGLTAMKVLVYMALEVGPKNAMMDSAKSTPTASPALGGLSRRSKLILPFSHFEVPVKFLAPMSKQIRTLLDIE